MEYHTDQFMIVTLHFLKYLSYVLQQFVFCFSTNQPMIPWLATELDQMMRQIYSLFIRGDYQQYQQTIFLTENLCEENEQDHLPLNCLELKSAVN